jgi:hypothetical protein
MSDQVNLDRLFDLMGAACEGGASPDDLDELDSVVWESTAARDWYLDYCRLHSTLSWELRAQGAAQKTFQELGFGTTAVGSGELDTAIKAETPASPIPILISTTFPGTSGVFASGWPLAYLIAAVVLSVGLVIGAFTYISQPRQVAVIPSAPGSSAHEPLATSPARVTTTVDCQWAAGVAPLHVNDDLPLGREIKLKSGLMEITYNSGAKVILQGPVTYEIESTSGGYLSVGKLTARLENAKTQDQRPKTKDLHHKSLNLQVCRFAVRTPTVTVTDLGTEFAVQVKPEGLVEVHVFEGQVETARVGPPGMAQVRQRLAAGEAIRFASTTTERIPAQLAPLNTYSLCAIPEARRSRLLNPIGLVATAYHRVWAAGGNLAAENDRRQAFQVATDGIFGRGEDGQGPRSSFDTLAATSTKSDFVGLLYGRPVRFDRIKVFLGRQSEDGGSWQQLPRLFILTNRVDPGSTPPEGDSANWRAVPLSLSYGASFSAKSSTNPGEVLEFVLTIPAEDRVGYGWAVGGVKGNGRAGCVSITELRAYGEEASHGK